jgi:hypothetical protein
VTWIAGALYAENNAIAVATLHGSSANGAAISDVPATVDEFGPRISWHTRVAGTRGKMRKFGNRYYGIGLVRRVS